MSNNLARSSVIFICITFISRILGYIRDMVAAHMFGVGPGYDAFIISFRIPNLLRRLFAEGAFSQAFIPILLEYQNTKSHKEVKQFINYISGNLASILLFITAIGITFAPLIIYLFAPGFTINNDLKILTTNMLRITFPYIFFISLTALAGSILNTYNRFAAHAFTPIILNIILIFISYFVSPYIQHPEIALACGVLLAGIIQLLFQIFFLWKLNILPKPHINWYESSVKRVLLLMFPAIFGAAISQITLLIDSWFASFLMTGSISWLYYADRLMEFPLGIIGVGLATVTMPHLAKCHINRDTDKFSKTLDWGIRCVFILGIPAMLGLFILSGPLIATLFQSGKFSKYDVIMSQKALMSYALSVLGIMLSKIFTSAFYATKNIKTPVKISIIILIINIVLNTIFIKLYAHIGIALSTSITSILNAIILAKKWYKINKFKFQPGWKIFLARILFANIGMILYLYKINYDLNLWLELNNVLRSIKLFVLIVSSIFIYISLLFFTGVRPKHFVIND